jgi:hypothetical protein
VLGTQRPRWIPLEAYDQATHLFFWRDTDEGNVMRVAELAGTRKRDVADIVPRLAKHDILYVNRDTSELVITRLPREEDNVIDFVHFLANLLIAGILLRFLEMKLNPDSDLKKALAFIY